jgi:hypothetical protein
MTGKFKKREIERKGTKKEMEKDVKLIEKNAMDLANPGETTEEYEEKSAPESLKES